MANLINIVEVFKKVSLQHPLVKSFAEGDPDLNNLEDTKYSLINIFCDNTTIGNTSNSSNVKQFKFTMFYIDRLLSNESNKLNVQTTGQQVIQEILNFIDANVEDVDITFPIVFTDFTQKYVNLCGGTYAEFIIEVNNDLGHCTSLNGAYVPTIEYPVSILDKYLSDVKIYPTLTTENKTIIGAINELNAAIIELKSQLSI